MRQNLKSKKKRNVMLLSALLVVVLLIGGTLALLVWQTNTAANQFDVTESVEGELFEPSWAAVVTSKANMKITPGQKLPKDPFISNSSNGDFDSNDVGLKPGENEDEADVYTAIKVTLRKDLTNPTPIVIDTTDDVYKIFNDYMHFTDKKDGTGNALQVLQASSQTTLDGGAPDSTYEDKNGNSLVVKAGAWKYEGKIEDASNDEISFFYVYDKVLEPDEVTHCLFQSVGFDTDLEQDDITELAGLDGFEIFLEGYTVQADNLTLANATTALKELAEQ